jgi:probable H4MPT-linked C1 transfer pathway protein
MTVGWDIGGVHTKVAVVSAGQIVCVREEPFELQRDPAGLVPLLQRLARAVNAPDAHSGAAAGSTSDAAAHALTLTAELSQMFRTKRDGVAFVVDAVETAFPGADVRVFTVDGGFRSPAEAKASPLDVAAANWMATARIVAQRHSDALLVDVGSTTTDIIPVSSGKVVAIGRTDLERLGAGELVYTGAVRTPVEAVVQEVTVRGRRVGVSAESFALVGDVHVWRGDLHEDDYTAPTPDGRARSRVACGERLLRVVCADREMLNDHDISAIADDVAAAQVGQIAAAIRRVAQRQPGSQPPWCRAIVTGRGTFLGAAAARRVGIQVSALEEEIGTGAARSAPAVAVALLLEQTAAVPDIVPDAAGSAVSAAPARNRAVPKSPRQTVGTVRGTDVTTPAIDVVVKIGGAALSDLAALDRVLAELDAAAGAIVVVPGGGPFADAVREVDRRVVLADATAHWMAVRGMDQYAELLVSRLRRGALVTDLDGVHETIRNGGVPVLAPHEWLRRDDPLPCSWEVTSDSIAAWVAGVTGARQLVLVKPGAARRDGLTDPYFEKALPEGVRTTFAFLDEPGGVLAVLDGPHMR